MSLRTSKWFRRIAIGTTAMLVLLSGLSALLKVMGGAAAETYTNVKGQHISYGSALLFVAVLVVSLAIGLMVRLRQRAKLNSPKPRHSAQPLDN